MIYRLIYFATFLLTSTLLKAQEQSMDKKMELFYEKDDKIYVVFTVILIVFASLIAYLVFLDVKLRRLELKSKK